ncbi:MAG: hypothetical protein HY681_03660 [Chloroflexi bacterium]|nr:hypothetical protein [Chloroflexota bacterium]
MAKVKTTPWNILDYLKTPEDMAGHLEAAFEEMALEECDPRLVVWIVKAIAEAKGLPQIPQELGLLTQDPPQFATVLKVIQALGLHLHVVPAQGSEEEAEIGATRA